jgi:IS1 family transposase
MSNVSENKLTALGCVLMALLLSSPTGLSQPPQCEIALKRVVGLEYPGFARMGFIRRAVELVATVSRDGTVARIRTASGSVLICLLFALLVGFGLLDLRSQPNTFILKASLPASFANNVSGNGHQRAWLARDASMDNLAMHGYPQFPRNVLPGLLLYKIQLDAWDKRRAWKYHKSRWGNVESCHIWRREKESECTFYSERKRTLVHDLKFNLQLPRLLRQRAGSLYQATCPIPHRDPLSHGGCQQIRLALHQIALLFHPLPLVLYANQGTNGDNNSDGSGEREKARQKRIDECQIERPSLDVLFPVCALLFYGGFGWSILVAFRVNHKRRILCASLISGGVLCSLFALFWAFMVCCLHPYTWGLPPQWLPQKWNPCPQEYRDDFSHNKNVTQQHLTRVTFPYYSKCMANVLAPEKQIAIIGSLCEGSSIRAIERMTGVHRDTVMRLGVRVGQRCTAMMNETLRDLDSTRLEMDEIWGFIGKKEKHVRPTDDPTTGDVWTFCAIDADSKLVPTFKVGKRTNAVADAFVQDVASRMRNRVQISTDGLKAYVDAIEHSFGGNVDYAQIIKTYGHEEVSNNRRYSAPEFVASEKRPVFGNPDVELISTSYVERLNATTRLHMRRLTRLTLAFSKKFENFEAAVGLHFAYYNFVKRHNTLRMTPAMAAGVSGTQWTVAQLLKAVA